MRLKFILLACGIVLGVVGCSDAEERKQKEARLRLAYDVLALHFLNFDPSRLEYTLTKDGVGLQANYKESARGGVIREVDNCVFTIEETFLDKETNEFVAEASGFIKRYDMNKAYLDSADITARNGFGQIVLIIQGVDGLSVNDLEGSDKFSARVITNATSVDEDLQQAQALSWQKKVAEFKSVCKGL